MANSLVSLAKRFVAWAGIPFIVEAVLDLLILIASAVLLWRLPPSRPYAAAAIVVVLSCLSRVHRLQPAYRRYCHARVGWLADKRMAQCRVAWSLRVAGELEEEHEAAATLASLRASNPLHHPSASHLQPPPPPLMAASAGNQLPAPMLVLSEQPQAQAQAQAQAQVVQSQPAELLQQEQVMTRSDGRVRPVRQLCRISRTQAMRIHRRQYLREQQQQEQQEHQQEEQPLSTGEGTAGSETATTSRTQTPLPPVSPTYGGHEPFCESEGCAVPVRDTPALATPTTANNAPFGGDASLTASGSDWRCRVRILSCSQTPIRHSCAPFPREPLDESSASNPKETDCEVRLSDSQG